MSLRNHKILKISLISLSLIFILIIVGLFIILKDNLNRRVGETLAKFSQDSSNSGSQSVAISNPSSSFEVEEVLSQVGDSVVAIDSKEENEKGDRNSIGSGIIIDPNGLIITNSLVVSDPSAKYVVILQNSQTYEVQEIKKDLETGLILIKIDAKDLKPFFLTIQNDLKLGQKIIGIDSANGLSNSVATGIVSGVRKEVKIKTSQFSNLIQTDLKLSGGSLGGPIVDYKGQLLGVLINPSKDNILYAISTNEIKKALSRYFAVAVQTENQAYLGVGYHFKDLKDYLNKGEPIGPVIDGVVKDSPATEAGIEVGDIVVSIDGKEFGDEEELTQFIKSQKPGNKIEIKMFRKGKLVDISAVFGQKN
jgi:serine protease Do